jgi:hypothetical protein
MREEMRAGNSCGWTAAKSRSWLIRKMPQTQGAGAGAGTFT